MDTSPFTAVDYLVVVSYLLLVVVAGSWMGKGQSTVADYFLAGRKMNWFVVCVSVAATDLSAISFTGVPAWLYAKDLKYTMGVFLLPFILLFVLFYFMRVFHRLKVFTTYEYLCVPGTSFPPRGSNANLPAVSRPAGSLASHSHLRALAGASHREWISGT